MEAATSWVCSTCGRRYRDSVAYCRRCSGRSRSASGQPNDSAGRVVVKNWFQGLGEIWVILGGLSAGCCSMIAAWVVWSADMPFWGRLGFSIFFLLFGLVSTPICAVVTWYAIASYTIWIEFDQQINVHWPSGVQSYGYDQVKSVEIHDERHSVGFFVAKQTTIYIDLDDGKSASAVLKGDRAERVKDCMSRAGFNWQPATSGNA